jgi:hypothetical protein
MSPEAVSCGPALTPAQPRHILCAVLPGLGLLVVFLATPSECRQQAAHCLTRRSAHPRGPSLTFALLARQPHQMPRFVDEE